MIDENTKNILSKIKKLDIKLTSNKGIVNVIHFKIKDVKIDVDVLEVEVDGNSKMLFDKPLKKDSIKLVKDND